MPDIERALSTLNTGAYLIPEAVDAGIRDYTAKATPLLSLVTRVPWPTNQYMYRKRTAAGTASWGTDGGSLPSATGSTYATVTSNVKYLYTRGEVTGPMIAAAGGVVNALQEEIRIASRVIAEKLTSEIAQGDGLGDNIEGILTQVPATDVTSDDSAGGTFTVGGALTLNAMDKALDYTRNEGDIILTSRAVRRKLQTLLQAQQSYVNTRDIDGGFNVLSYNGIPIITDLHWEANDTILIFRRADAKLIVNKDFFFQPLAKTKDTEDFFIGGYFGFVLEGRPVKMTFTSVTT